MYRFMPRNAAGRLDPAALGYAGWLDFDPFAGAGAGPVIIQHAEPLPDSARPRLLKAADKMFPGRGCLFLPASVVAVDVREHRGGREAGYTYAIRPLPSCPCELVGVGDFEGQRFAVRVIPCNPWGNRPLVCFQEDFPPVVEDAACRETVKAMMPCGLLASGYIVARTDRTFARAVRLKSAGARPARRRERTGRRG